jgi:UDP-N-acetylmuramoyl-L-alanyl-D-glutamate--2,6-diaminopimelate ligase
VPKTHTGVLRLLDRCRKAGGRYAVLEITSEVLARGFARALPLFAGVFTNLTHDHLDAHKSPEHYFASKAQLFVHLAAGGVAVVNGCDAASELLLEVIPPEVRRMSYGVLSRGAEVVPLDARADDVAIGWRGTRARLASPSGALALPDELSTRAIGDVYVENALAALVAAVALGAVPARAAAAIAEVPAPAGRFELVREAPHVVVDYAHTPDALLRTLRAARALCTGTLTVVFGAGGDRDRDKREPMGVASAAADRVILTSDNPRSESPTAIAEAIRRGIPDNHPVEVELDRERAIQKAVNEASAGDVVVVAGKGHEVSQESGGQQRRFSDREIVLGTR